MSNSTANLANLAGIGGLLRIRGAGVAVEQSQIRLTGSTTGQVQIESRAQGAALGTALSGLEDGITAEIAVGNTTIADSQISVELGADIGATGPIVTGHVDILGPGQVLIASSDIAANQVRIGGDFQGQGEVVTAQDTIVDASSTISTLLSPFAAHANLPLSSDSPQSPSANPGRVIIWADDKTRFLGYLHNPAGFAEVSGKNELDLGPNWFSRIQTGELLLDPNDIVIAPGSGTAVSGNPTNANTLYADSISTFLATSDLTIQTTGTGGNGDITVNGALSWSANQLALYADRNIQINADLAITGTGSVRMAFGQGTTDGSGATYTVANGVSIKIPLPTGSQTTATSAFTWQQGSAGTVNQLVFNNGYLAFGTGSHQQVSAANTSAVNPQGLLTQPNYFDNVTAGRNAYYKLTYSSNPLNLEIGTGTGGTRWNGNTTFASTQGGTYTPQAGGYLEISGYRPGVGSGPGGGPKGS
ncbi:MAG: hypothetical protein ACO4AI_07525, partial [Prochlorothrix sp.]